MPETRPEAPFGCPPVYIVLRTFDRTCHAVQAVGRTDRYARLVIPQSVNLSRAESCTRPTNVAQAVYAFAVIPDAYVGEQVLVVHGS